MTEAEIRHLNQENVEAMALFAQLLGREAPLFSADEIASFAADCALPLSDAYALLIAAACGKEEDRLFQRVYLAPALRVLDVNAYRRNPYLLRIHFPEKALGDWQFKWLSYAPYQLFPCGHTRLTDQGREIPAIGYFSQRFSYPAVLENGREWMTVTPNEIETMAPDLQAAQGRVAVLGLGLGYFAFMAAQKKSVSAVTIVEREAAAIALFQAHLLPQFPEKEKITVCAGDALDFLGRSPDDWPFDYVFIDLWHDVGDGLPLYLRCRQLAARFPRTRFHYWIEQDLLIFLRGLLLEDDPALGALSLPQLQRLAPQIAPVSLTK